nr:retrotransposon protein, putative, unclassified [Tanacetum cinerariifolium]
KFDGKADEGFFVGYFLNSKAFRLFSNRTRIMEENLHIRFSENTPNIVGGGPNWLFDIDALTESLNYRPFVIENQSNGNASAKACDDADKARIKTVPSKDYILLPLWTADPLISQGSKSSQDDVFQPSNNDGKKVDEDPKQESECKDQEKEDNDNSTNYVNVVGTNGVNTISITTNNELPFDPKMPKLEDISTFTFLNKDEDDGTEADIYNLDTTIQVSPTPTIRIHKDHPLDQVIGNLHSTTQTRHMSKNLEEHGLVTTIHQRTNHKDLQNCLFAFFITRRTQKVLFFMERLKKEVYICQQPGFEDPDFPNKVYKVEKALYRLHQPPTAWRLWDVEVKDRTILSSLRLCLWYVIENGNSFNLVPRITANADGTSTLTISGPVTTEEKEHKKNDVNARSMLLMAIPNEHLLTFSQYKDSKTLFKAIQARFDAFLSTPGSTNEVDTATIQVSTICILVSTVSTHDNTANLSDTTVYAFLANQPNGSQLYFQRTHKKITINGSDTKGYDKKKVECFNCHKMGHSARECRSSRCQETRPRNQDSSRKIMIVEDTSSKAMVAINGAGFDWSYMADDNVPTNMALMAFLDSKGNLVRGLPLKIFKNDHSCVAYQKGKQHKVSYLPHGKRAIGNKCVYRNKRDQRGIVVRNKARLIAQGHGQEEGIDYDKVFAPVARIKAIRAWYETLSNYLLENGFRRGTTDKTLFIKKIKNDILLVQVYVDDIIFGSTKRYLRKELKGYLLNDGYADLVQHARQTATSKEFLNPLMAGSLPKTISAKISAVEPFSSLNNSMANLNFVDQHNMVAYLEKSDDNTEFHQIVDFLSLCSIIYALTIYAIVDGKVIVISESLMRSDLLFDDEDGISCLTNNEIFENLALMGYEPLSTKLTFQKDEAVNQEEGDRVERAITTDASLEGIDTGGSPMRQETMGGTSTARSERVLEQPNEPPLTEGHTSGSGEGRLKDNIKLTDIVPTVYYSPLIGGYTPRSDEGRITLAELMKTCTTLSNRVTQLGNELLTTKAVYNKAFITLTNRLKKLESQLKQKRSSAVIHSSNEEGPKVQETAENSRDDDDEILAETLLNIKRSSTNNKGKGIMQETELPKKLKKKEMIQLSLDKELA